MKKLVAVLLSTALTFTLPTAAGARDHSRWDGDGHHWRGDRANIGEFAEAFVSLLGRAGPPDVVSMSDLETYLLANRPGPNPRLARDRTLEPAAEREPDRGKPKRK